MGAIEQLSEKLGEDEISKGVEKKLKEYHHLITKESALHLLALEIIGPVAEVNEIEIAKIKLAPCILEARLEKAYIPKIFQKAGNYSRTQRIEVSDQSGGATVVCYDEAALAIGTHAVVGDLLAIGPVKYSKNEFHLQHSGSVKRMQKGARVKISEKKGGNFEGKISSFFGDFAYRRGQAKLTGGNENAAGKQNYGGGMVGGESALMTSFELEDGSGRARVVVWNSGGMQGVLKKGMEIEIENGAWKNGEVHVNSFGRLVFERGESKLPKVEKIEIEGENVLVFAKGEKINIGNLEQACSWFGIGEVPEGISARTALELKKNDFLGKPMPEKWIEGKK